MAYLASMRVIHCDLAGRNVLLTDKLVAKITDFGLAKILQKDKDYYTRSTGKELPLMWSVYNMNYVKLHSITCLRCTAMNVNLRYLLVAMHRVKCWEMKDAWRKHWNCLTVFQTFLFSNFSWLNLFKFITTYQNNLTLMYTFATFWNMIYE